MSNFLKDKINKISVLAGTSVRFSLGCFVIMSLACYLAFAFRSPENNLGGQSLTLVGVKVKSGYRPLISLNGTP